MLQWIKKNKAIVLCAVLAAAVNFLMLLNLIEKKHLPFMGISSRKGLFLLQLSLDFLLLLVCFSYARFIGKKKKYFFAVVLTALTPFAGVCLMEGITGNLGTLTRAGLFLNFGIACVMLILLLLFFKISVRQQLYRCWSLVLRISVSWEILYFAGYLGAADGGRIRYLL